MTVLFADMTGSTALGERLDPESFRRVMARYFDTARGCLERHGGTVEKFIGDAVMAVFGVPTVHEDDAPARPPCGRRAPRLARVLQRGARARLRRLASAAHRRQHGRGRHRHGGATRHRRRRQRRRSAGAGRPARRDPARGADTPARPRRHRGRAGRGAFAQREGGASAGPPALARRRGRACLRPAARRPARGTPRGARAGARGVRCERLGEAMPPRDRPRAARDRQVAARPRAGDEPGGRGRRPLRPLPPIRRGHHLLAARRDLSRGRRRDRARGRALRRSAGGDLLVCPEGGRGEEFEEIVGYHLEQAYSFLAELGPLDDRARALAERAAGRLSASGQRAYARGDMPAAANLLDRTARLFPSDDRRRLNLLPSLGRTLIETGQWEAAESLLSQAVGGAQAAGERAAAANAAIELAYLRLHTDPQASHEQITPELDDAIRVFEELQDEAGLARALNLAGLMRFWRGESAAAIEDLEQAARYAHEAGDRAQEAESLRGVLVAAAFGPTPVESALERIEDVRRRGKGNRRLEVTVLALRAWLEAMRGRLDAARDLIAEAKGLAEELGLEMMLATSVLRLTGEIELLAGDPDAAEHALRPACEALERMGDLGHFASVAPVFADALYAQGRGKEAAPWIELASSYRIEDDLDAQAGWRRARARLLAQGGDFEAAERLAREATDLAARTDFLDAHARALADLAEVLRLAERPKEAAAALEEAIGLHEQKGNVVAAGRLPGLLAEPPIEVWAG